MRTEDWRDVLAADDLPAGRAATVRIDGTPILLRHETDGTLSAIDNLCPHEGYPLSQGEVKDGLLTCAWHHWKFRLRDGACVLGGEDVRRYPLEVREGRVWVDVAPPAADLQLAKLEQSMERAFGEDDWGHVARDVERMLMLGRPPQVVLAFGCDWSARHLRYGFGHGLAAAADYAALIETFPEHTTLALTEALHGLVNPNLRRARRTFAKPEVLAVEHGDAGWSPLGRRLRQLIEDENLEGAQALIRGALADATPPEVVFGWLVGAATDHFLDFAHAHIYVVKADELLRAVGWQHAHPILTSVVSMLVYGTREDTLPYMRAYRTRWPTYEARLDAWSASQPKADASLDVESFVDTILGNALEPALDAVADALDVGVAPDRIALFLALAASRRLLCFDPSIADRDDVSEGWLHCTHLLTHADAVRETLLRWPSRDALRGLFQSARFIQHTYPLAELPQTYVAAPDAGIEALGHALAGNDPHRAVSVSRALLATDRDAFERAVGESCLFTPFTRPIFVQHHVKTVLAAQRVARALCADSAMREDDAWMTPWLGTVRFLAHRHRERRVRDAVRWAQAFVRRGEMRGNLLGY